MNNELAATLLHSIEGNQLVIMCGAGLSMASPSSLPSAANLAETCWHKYRNISGNNLPEEMKFDIEAMAKYFADRNELVSIFIRQLLPWDQFLKSPNLGHKAIADFLLCEAIEFTLSTNLDTLIESAAKSLGERDFRAAFDNQSIYRTDYNYNLLLKLHGCMHIDRERTIWCTDQLSDTIINARIESFKNWITGRLPEHDILIIGFWTDWAYLNSVLIDTLSEIEPRSVILVDPSESSILEEKAPDVLSWGNGSNVNFTHIQDSGDTFLDDLRECFSEQFLKRIISEGESSYIQCFGSPTKDIFTFDPNYTTDDLYTMRRYFTGVSTNQCVRIKQPSRSHELIGLCHILLIEQGATLEGAIYTLKNESIRIINSGGELLSSVINRFKNESMPFYPTSVAVGAVDDPTPHDIIRGKSSANIVRTENSGNWMTFEDLKTKLGIQ